MHGEAAVTAKPHLVPQVTRGGEGLSHHPSSCFAVHHQSQGNPPLKGQDRTETGSFEPSCDTDGHSLTHHHGLHRAGCWAQQWGRRGSPKAVEAPATVGCGGQRRDSKSVRAGPRGWGTVGGRETDRQQHRHKDRHGETSVTFYCFWGQRQRMVGMLGVLI